MGSLFACCVVVLVHIKCLMKFLSEYFHQFVVPLDIKSLYETWL